MANNFLLLTYLSVGSIGATQAGTLPTRIPTLSPSPIPIAVPTPSWVGDEVGFRGRVQIKFDPLTECPAPTPSTCSHQVKQATIFGDEDQSHLVPCPKGTPNLFVEDPWSGAVMHACGAGDGEKHNALSNSCAETRFRDLAVDTQNEKIYMTAGSSIRRANLTEGDPGENLEDFIAGFTTVYLRGFNLGNSRAEVLSLKVKGEECGTIVYHNSTALSCTISDPSILSTPINHYCISLTVKGSLPITGAVDEVIAIARKGSGGNKPVLYSVTVDYNGGFQPVAIAVDGHRNRIFWSNKASSTIQSARLDGTGMIQHASGLPRVADMVLSDDGMRLYFTESDRGAVMVLHINQEKPKNIAGERMTEPEFVDKLVDGLKEPWGLALDEPNFLLFVVESGAGEIHRMRLGNLQEPSKVSLQRVVKVNTYTQLSEVAILKYNDGVVTDTGIGARSSGGDFRDARLLWTETNSDRVRRSTIHGTLQEDLSAIPLYGVAEPLIWPRSIVADPRPNRDVVYVAEYLGRVWELGTKNSTHSRLLVDHASYGSTAQIRSFLAQSERSSAASADPQIKSFLRLSV